MKVYTQQEGFFICGKIKEVRLLLSEYSKRYRTVKEMIIELFN
ncbi:Z-ring formation inhibitor MciZ [Pelotomaculum propionicicum]